MEPPPTPSTLRERLAACRVCLAVGLLACLGVVYTGVSMTWLIPPDIPAAVAWKRAHGVTSQEILLAIERNPWRPQDGRGPLPLGDGALWLTVGGAGVGLLALVLARGSGSRRWVLRTSALLWAVGTGLIAGTLTLYRHAYLDATTPWDARPGTVAYHVERENNPGPSARISERTRLGPVEWGAGVWVALAGAFGGTGLMVLASRARGQPEKETAAPQP